MSTDSRCRPLSAYSSAIESCWNFAIALRTPALTCFSSRSKFSQKLLANASCGMDHLMLMMTDGVLSPIGPVAATSSDAFAESLGDLLAPVRAGGPHALVVGEPINQLLEVHVHGRFDQAGVDVGR